MPRSLAVLALVTIASAVVTAGPQQKPAPVPPSAPTAASVVAAADYEGAKVNASHGLAWWDAENGHLKLALFGQTPPPGILAGLRKGSWGEGGPSMIVTLGFKKGAPPALASTTYCDINVTFPKAGPIGYGTDAKGCGLTLLGGQIRPGGVVSAKLKGQAPTQTKPYTYDITVTLPIAK